MFPEAPPPIFGHSTFDLAPQFLAQTHLLLRDMSSVKPRALIELGWHQRTSATAVGQQSQLSPIFPVTPDPYQWVVIVLHGVLLFVPFIYV